MKQSYIHRTKILDAFWKQPLTDTVSNKCVWQPELLPRKAPYTQVLRDIYTTRDIRSQQLNRWTSTACKEVTL